MITHDQLGDDEDLAREVLVVAHDIAPCLSSLATDSEQQKNALAIIRRVYRDTLDRGSRLVKGQRIGSASVDYADIASAFEGQPTRALRAICAARKANAAPRGSFPTDRPLQRLWPEHYA
ncbi:hypothetical protein [Microbacterium sp. IEGM 1404]|uniref:hypothetical protein n=1 Tax=Microbacterium sp. IEGM 1404 TaxID=3047084 RepID=UPI0024B76742|nr:hypothetical protein [Microbacterium sp. IEGM 1404]MDI9889970.1 hypothetical protein [Microbacterium sp. IEGM 1404]